MIVAVGRPFLEFMTAKKARKAAARDGEKQLAKQVYVTGIHNAGGNKHGIEF